MQKMYLALNVSSVTVFYSHFSLAVLCLCVFVVMEQHGWVGFHQDKHAGQCPSQEADRFLFWMCSVPRGAADTMSSRRGMVGRDQPSSFWLCQDGYFRYTGILRWDRLHCSTFPRARKQLGVFSLAEHRDSVGSSVASPASPSPGVEGPWCRDPAPGGGGHESSSPGHCCPCGSWHLRCGLFPCEPIMLACSATSSQVLGMPELQF